MIYKTVYTGSIKHGKVDDRGKVMEILNEISHSLEGTDSECHCKGHHKIEDRSVKH